MKPIKRLLVPVDFSESSKHALRYALDLAEQLGGEVVLLHVWHTPPLVEGDLIIQPGGISRMKISDWMKLEAARALELFIEPLDKARFTTRLAEGTPSELIPKLAQDEGFDLIVMGTVGRSGLKRWMMGSVAERVVRTASCPVLTVRQPAAPPAPDKHP